ncbi:MAG: gamma-glutamylcyclotransferase [Nitrospinae bacterium]|nr:gamma-glutamylcyclotransferase [Nitrospinota bacterium]
MPSQEPINLFVYGTLVDPQRVKALAGKQFARVAATLEGFERMVPDTGYPYILPKPGAAVSGFLLKHLDAVSLNRLDRYEAEGDLYLRQEVEVLVAGQPVHAMTYVGHSIRALARTASRQKNGVKTPRCLPDAAAADRGMQAPSSDARSR